MEYAGKNYRAYKRIYRKYAEKRGDKSMDQFFTSMETAVLWPVYIMLVKKRVR